MVVQDAVELCPDFARRTGRAKWPGRIDPQVLEYVDHAAEDYRSRKGDGRPAFLNGVLGAGTQPLAEEPVKSSTALANASGFSSGMK
jgi:hypothetical protein